MEDVTSTHPLCVALNKLSSDVLKDIRLPRSLLDLTSNSGMMKDRPPVIQHKEGKEKISSTMLRRNGANEDRIEKFREKNRRRKFRKKRKLEDEVAEGAEAEESIVAPTTEDEEMDTEGNDGEIQEGDQNNNETETGTIEQIKT